MSFFRMTMRLPATVKSPDAIKLRVTGRRNSCAEVKSITEQRIADIPQRINELKRLERALSMLVAQCRRNEIPECAVLDALAGCAPALAGA
jgi:MerR family mercuric resistance operon transcriptional regulator